MANESMVDALARSILTFRGTGRDKMVIYIFRCGEYRKVGITNNIEQRQEAFQSSTPYEVILERYRTVPGYSARHIEKLAHSKLNTHWHRHEWFTCDAETAYRAVVEAIREIGKLAREAERQARRFEGAIARPSAADDQQTALVGSAPAAS